MITYLSRSAWTGPMIYTVAPLDRRVVEIIRPIPVPPPVTTATTPDMSNMLVALRVSRMFSAMAARVRAIAVI